MQIGSEQVANTLWVCEDCRHVLLIQGHLKYGKPLPENNIITNMLLALGSSSPDRNWHSLKTYFQFPKNLFTFMDNDGNWCIAADSYEQKSLETAYGRVTRLLVMLSLPYTVEYHYIRRQKFEHAPLLCRHCHAENLGSTQRYFLGILRFEAVCEVNIVNI